MASPYLERPLRSLEEAIGEIGRDSAPERPSTPKAASESDLSLLTWAALLSNP